MRPSRKFAELVDALINAQRRLTRALVHQNPDLGQQKQIRTGANAARDNARAALDLFVGTVEYDLATLREEHHVLANEIMQVRYVVQLLREMAPDVVTEAEARASTVVRVPDTTLRSYEDAIEMAIENGHAKRTPVGVVIIYGGLLELARAAGTRQQLEDARTEIFELGQKVYLAEKRQQSAAVAS